ncbi:MAG: acyl-ACP--UDP-N-acetylglucosamine O-acyltransferase [Mariprofundales bacterium]
MSYNIHKTAVVHPDAEIHPEASIGPFCVVGENVILGQNSQLLSHIVLHGHTHIGANNRFFPFSSIGHEPQDLKYHGEYSEVIIGDNNTIRENVTINPGTEGGGSRTIIGCNNLLMAYVHIAHDCHVASNVIMANAATLAGHVSVDDHAIIGGLSAVHQFLRIGRYAMIGGMSGIVKDVPPFTLTAGGYRPGLAGLNLIGLRRAGFSRESISLLRQLYSLLLQPSSEPLSQRLEQAKIDAGTDKSAHLLIDFVANSKRGLTMHRRDAN